MLLIFTGLLWITQERLRKLVAQIRCWSLTKNLTAVFAECILFCFQCTNHSLVFEDWCQMHPFQTTVSLSHLYDFLKQPKRDVTADLNLTCSLWIFGHIYSNINMKCLTEEGLKHRSQVANLFFLFYISILHVKYKKYSHRVYIELIHPGIKKLKYIASTKK